MSGDKGLEEVEYHDLRKMAKDDYGLSFGANVKKVEIIEAIRKEETGQAQSADAGETTGKTVLGKFFPNDDDTEFNVIDIIEITEDPDNNAPVFASVNGRNCTIPRGSQQPVRRPLVLVLKNAVEERYNPETMEKTFKLRHPFQVIEHDVS